MGKSREQRMTELRSACGCKEGLISFVIGVAAYCLALQYFLIGSSTLQRVLIGIAAGLGSGVIGKLLALVLAQLELRRLQREPGVGSAFK